jgi:transcriptional regulator with XRE-family HTH domain
VSENLWALREQKKMSVAALANRAGLPIGLILEYEAGQRSIDPRHLGRLARALYVEESQIKLQSEPRPAASVPDRQRQREPGASAAGAQPAAEGASATHRQERPVSPAEAGSDAIDAVTVSAASRPRARPPKPRSVPRPPAPARPSQIAHLDNLLSRLNRSRDELEIQVGKSVAELDRAAITELLKTLQVEIQATAVERRRAYLPESVDRFEAKYLTEAQEAGSQLRFTLFDGSVVAGQVIGFGPYSITIRLADGVELTLNKLALVSYTRNPSEADVQERAV